MIASRDCSLPLASACSSTWKACVGADVEDGAHRFALHLRLVVVEQLGEVGQRLAAAELAHQLNRRAADRRVRRALQPLDRPPPDGAERQQHRRQPLARAAALLGGERLGERTHQHLAERDAHRLDALELRVVDRGQMGDDVPHHRPRDEHVDGDDALLPSHLGVLAGRGRGDDVDQTGGGIEVADEQQILEHVDHRRHQLAPAVVVLFDAQQVEQQRDVERAHRRRRTVVSQPVTRSGGSSLTRSTSMACALAARARAWYVSET